MVRPKGETDDERKARQAREVKLHERAAGVVPGTGRHNGKIAHGGQQWGDLARMAAAREAGHVPLSKLDAEALRRHPQPTGWVGT